MQWTSCRRVRNRNPVHQCPQGHFDDASHGRLRLRFTGLVNCCHLLPKPPHAHALPLTPEVITAAAASAIIHDRILTSHTYPSYIYRITPLHVFLFLPLPISCHSTTGQKCLSPSPRFREKTLHHHHHHHHRPSDPSIITTPCRHSCRD